MLRQGAIMAGFGMLAASHLAAASGYDGIVRQKDRIWDVPTKSVVRHASSRLLRKNDGVCVTADTHGLHEGAYTVWWVLYNEPDQCNNPVPYGDARCGDLDIANPAVRATVMWAAGKLVGPDGRAHINACIGNGELSHEVFDMGTKEGLTDPMGAEIQLVVHYHDKAAYTSPALLGDQLTSFVGGCEDPGALEPPACTDSQQIVHTAPARGGFR